MIQRKQTLWLLIASIAAFLTLKLPFYTGNIAVQNVKLYKELNASMNIILLITTLLVALGCLATIFLFRDRNKQLIFSTVAAVLSVLIIILNFWQKQKFIDGFISITSVLTFIVPIFIALAIKGIYDDEKLLKSVDRLR